MSIELKVKCPECGSSDYIEWHSTVEANSSVADGRLRVHDITPVFYAGCEFCSETVKVISGDCVADILTQLTRSS